MINFDKLERNMREVQINNLFLTETDYSVNTRDSKRTASHIGGQYYLNQLYQFKTKLV